MKKSRLYLVGLAASLAITGTASQAIAGDDITRGELMAATCVTCHNEASASNGIADLANYPAELIVSQMKAIRDGDRPALVMNRHAAGYTDAEIEALAGYLERF